MLKTGQKTVATAGVRVALGSGMANGPTFIRAAQSNTGLIYLGDSGVTSSNGYILEAGVTMLIEMLGDLSKVFIDSSVNSQKVSFVVIDLV